MKADIDKNGYIRVIAESYVEAYALRGLTPIDLARCSECHQTKLPVIIDCSVLNDGEG